jgi:hypothetical protein
VDEVEFGALSLILASLVVGTAVAAWVFVTVLQLPLMD